MAQRYKPRNFSANDIDVSDVNPLDILVDTTKVMLVNANEIPRMTNVVFNRARQVLDLADDFVADSCVRMEAYLREGRHDRGISDKVDPKDVDALRRAYFKAQDEEWAKEEKTEAQDRVKEIEKAAKAMEKALTKLGERKNSLPESLKAHADVLAAFKAAEDEILANFNKIVKG